MRRTLFVLGLIVGGIVLMTLLATAFVVAFMSAAHLLGVQHTVGGDVQTTKAYATVSGYLPMIVTALGFSGLLVSWWHHWNCYVPGCWRKGHADPKHGHPVCRVHQAKL